MTYVPPEKKHRGGSFGDFIYVLMFYLIEGIFIIIGIPFLMLAVGVIPVAMYLVITRGGASEQINLYLTIGAGVIVVFAQIMGVQYFVRKYVLEPNNMKFGEWLRWKFSPTEIKNRRAEKIARSEKMEKWYDGMDKIHERKALIKEEQSIDMRGEWFKETGDPEEIASQSSDDSGIILGEFEEETEEAS
ncbi:MAG: hypothetical protein GPJ52_01480 [Candidatus Heimdallarchaeota archaeon]|nr:hypothetical protein [Candidatus Heimdallarchaeota archaeon]